MARGMIQAPKWELSIGHYDLTDAEWKAIEPHSPLITLGSGRDSALEFPAV